LHYDPGIMNESTMKFPAHYRSVVRVYLRFALVFLVVGLLSGVAFQESSKKFDASTAGDLSYWDATLRLALVHGHIFMVGVLLPVALLGMLHLARAYGGAEIGPKALRWTSRLYLPCAAVTVALMLYKGYHILLSARVGTTDLDTINATYFGGITALRHTIYGLAHTGMAVGLGIFVWSMWRSLRTIEK
jgi:hypothetical protein